MNYFAHKVSIMWAASKTFVDFRRQTKKSKISWKYANQY